jgi:hypothetical protein
MGHGKLKPKERQIGKKTIEKKPLINPKYKNTFWTAVIVFILLIFFIVNNTSSVPVQGPYPPSYNPSSPVKPDTAIDKKLIMKIENK